MGIQQENIYILYILMVFLLSHWEIHHCGIPFLREYVLWGVLEQTQGGIDPMFLLTKQYETYMVYIYISVCIHFMNIIGNVPKNDNDFIVM